MRSRGDGICLDDIGHRSGSGFPYGGSQVGVIHWDCVSGAVL